MKIVVGWNAMANARSLVGLNEFGKRSVGCI